MIRRIFLCCLIVLLSTATGLTQNITTMWPYKYSDFCKGTIYFKNQQPLLKQLNVHLLKSTLHYLDGEKIREANSKDVAYVVIDHSVQGVHILDKYYVVDNQLMRVAGGDSTAFVAELILADLNSISDGGGAYGSSSNVQATRKLSSLEFGGINITNHMELKSKKDEGTLLPLTQKYFIVIGDLIYPATSKGIESQLPNTKKEEFKQFVKKNKINWKDPTSLATLLSFLKN